MVSFGSGLLAFIIAILFGTGLESLKKWLIRLARKEEEKEKTKNKKRFFNIK